MAEAALLGADPKAVFLQSSFLADLCGVTDVFQVVSIDLANCVSESLISLICRFPQDCHCQASEA